METINDTHGSLIDQTDLRTFKEKTDQLLSNLENNDFESALRCIHEINSINDQSMYNIIGKLTRGLHRAINDLNRSSAGPAGNESAPASLDYVIQMTDEAAAKTLDMTEQSTNSLRELTTGLDRQDQLLRDYLAANAPDPALEALLGEISSISADNRGRAAAINGDITEIVVAQNYQDLASQSITKAIHIIKDVEGSLISLTQYANLLKKLSQFSDQGKQIIEAGDSEEIKSNLGQLNKMPDSEHLDQNAVDDLLSSLGF